jgi:hypothetical protein
MSQIPTLTDKANVSNPYITSDVIYASVLK